MRFLSITSFRRLSADVNFDADGTPALLQLANVNQQSRTYSQEFQLASASSSKIDWIVGAFAWRDRTSADPLKFMLATTTFDRFTTQKSTSLAAFGQATFPLGDATNLIAGLRYTRDTRRLDGRDVRTTGATAYPRQSEVFPKLTWRASLDHRFSPEAMVYLQYNRGFKSGVFNLDGPADPAARPQVVDTYELGVKTDFWTVPCGSTWPPSATTFQTSSCRFRSAWGNRHGCTMRRRDVPGGSRPNSMCDRPAI